MVPPSAKQSQENATRAREWPLLLAMNGCETEPNGGVNGGGMAAKQDRTARLGAALREARRGAGLSRGAMAERAGVSLSAAKAAEAGGGTVQTFQALAQAVGHRLAAKAVGGGMAGLAVLRGRQMSQRAAGAAAGLSRGAVATVERGDAAGQFVSLVKYCEAVGAGLALVPAGALPFFTATGNASVWHGWETPAALFDAIEAGAGAFDLDPCAPDRPGTVRAVRRYTVADDGLGREWRGRVFMNPPYGRALPRWLAKAAAEAEAGAEVVGLIPARTDTAAWHKHVAGRADVLMLRGRVAFGDGAQAAPFPSAVILWGGRPETLAGLREALPGSWFIPRSAPSP